MKGSGCSKVLNEMGESLTCIEGGRVDNRGIDGRTLRSIVAVGLGRIHSNGRRCDVARQTTSSSSAGRDVENGGACRATCLDIVGWIDKPQDEVVENDAREQGKVADLGKDGNKVGYKVDGDSVDDWFSE